MVMAPRSRWRFVNILPLALIISIIGSIAGAYAKLHIAKILGNDETYNQGIVQAVISGFLTFMLCLNYFLAIFTDPGQVPSDDYQWIPEEVEQPAQDLRASQLNEVKKTGERRHCKWCGKYKPDRTHHCRICQRCVLKMDHHCPWIANCVGWRNHKYFFLVVIYAVLDCYFVSITMYPTVVAALSEEMLFGARFLLVFGETLAIVMCGPVTIFLSFHGWLMSKGLTTIEFCEKNIRGNDNVSIYNHGCLHNAKAVLGPNPLLWFVPVNPAEGDGLSFAVSSDVVKSERESLVDKGGKGRESKVEREPEIAGGEPREQNLEN